jgi:cell division protein WhiA
LSLTRQVKEELTRQEDGPECCSSWELKAILLKNGYYTFRQKEYSLSAMVDHISVARRLFNLLRKAGVETPLIYKRQEVRLRRSQFVVQVFGSDQVDALLTYLDLKEVGHFLTLSRRHAAIPKRSCCRKAFLKGAFLAGGSISVSRRSGYHLEINCGSPEDTEVYQQLLHSYHLVPLLRIRNDSAYLYFKNAESVADFLRIIGAGSTLLQLESQRVVKSMRNRVNRLVNCETANLSKVVASAQHQLDLIDELDRTIGLNNLSSSLRDIALLRRKYPEASFTELGELLKPPVTKSGVSHRFRQLEKIIRKAGPS